MLLKHTDFSLQLVKGSSQSLEYLGRHENYTLEYGLKFIPWKFEERFFKQKRNVSLGELRMLKHSSVRSPQLALVCSDLEVTPESLYLMTIAKAVQELGYKLELYAFIDGPMEPSWVKAGVPVYLLHLDGPHKQTPDWSNFEGVIVNSLNCKHVISNLMQEPFKLVRVIWIISEDILGWRLRLYEDTGLMDLTLNWKQAFKRADAIVFPGYSLPMVYSTLDSGNYFVIPGFPFDIWVAEQYLALHKRDEVRKKFGLDHQDFAISIVGNSFTYKSVWREHALIMKSILPVAGHFKNVAMKGFGSLKMFFVYGNSSSDYGFALQKMALHLGLEVGTIFHFGIDTDLNGLLWAADVVVYCSLREDQAFPNILIRAMAFERFIVAPNSTALRTHIVDGVNGFLFVPGDVDGLTHTFFRVISEHTMSTAAMQNVSRTGSQGHGLLVADSMVGYCELFEAVFEFPSDVMLPLPVSHLSEAVKRDWQWQLLPGSGGTLHWGDLLSKDLLKSYSLVYELEQQLNNVSANFEPFLSVESDYFMQSDNTDLQTEKLMQGRNDIEQREEDELEDRLEQLQGSWEDVYRSVKKAEKEKDELIGTDDGELERTGQPLCIYEPFYGAGAWPFLHSNNALYRGISLFPAGMRSGVDDVNAAQRLPLLNDSYYQNVLCEYGAIFAVATHIDQIHKNAWIGFQSWRAAGRKVALSSEAEKMLGDRVRTGMDGDAVYFWAQMNDDRRNPLLDNTSKQHEFWLFCDAVNNGNCRSIFLEAFKQLYGLPSTWKSLPPMPSDSGTWGALHCWAMPTSSFVEFAMFTRMYIDILDSQYYADHHDKGLCCLGISKSEIKHCYCRLLELLVNVWAYHSARRMIYLDPSTGLMDEQHRLETRKGQMWVSFFNSSTLKGMDEDLAEEADAEHSSGFHRRWLWPQTGEVFSPGINEREQKLQYFLRMEKKRKNRERIERIRNRYKQKPLAGG
eukprot:c23181_g1_i1 orf=1-2895(+)